MENKETYSIPIYENGIKTEYSIDGTIGECIVGEYTVIEG